VILRPPVISDYQFIFELYQDWPITDRGPVTIDRAIAFTRRWIARDDEVCQIAEEGEPVGLISYRKGGDFGVVDLTGMVVVDNIIVHPSHRGLGHSTAIARELREKLVSEGITLAEFDALEGPISAQIERGRYELLGEVQGQTGVLVRGRLTVDMEI